MERRRGKRRRIKKGMVGGGGKGQNVQKRKREGKNILGRKISFLIPSISQRERKEEQATQAI